MNLERIDEIKSECQHAIKVMLDNPLSVLAIGAIYEDGRVEKHSEMTILPFLEDEDNLEGLDKLVITEYVIPTDAEPTIDEEHMDMPLMDIPLMGRPFRGKKSHMEDAILEKAEDTEQTGPKVKVTVLR